MTHFRLFVFLFENIGFYYRGLSFSPKVSESQDQRKVVINIVLPIEAYTFSAWGATVHSFSLIDGN